MKQLFQKHRNEYEISQHNCRCLDTDSAKINDEL